MNSHRQPDTENTARPLHPLVLPCVTQRAAVLLGECDSITTAWRKAHDKLLMDVGWMMRVERERCRMSLRELARNLNVSAPHLSDMELGRRKYSIEWVRKAVEVLRQNVLLTDSHADNLKT